MQIRMGLVRPALLLLCPTRLQFSLALSMNCVFQAREEALMCLGAGANLVTLLEIVANNQQVGMNFKHTFFFPGGSGKLCGIVKWLRTESKMQMLSSWAVTLWRLACPSPVWTPASFVHTLGSSEYSLGSSECSQDSRADQAAPGLL